MQDDLPMPDSDNNQAQPSVADIIMNVAIDRIAMLPIGKTRKQHFMRAVQDFMADTKNPEEDQKTIDAIYAAIINLQNAIFNEQPTETLKRCLQHALYDPSRPRNLAGIQSAALFANDVHDSLVTLLEDMKRLSGASRAGDIRR